MHHYLLIQNWYSLIHRFRKRVPKSEHYLFPNCFHVSSSQALYNKHIGFCQQNKPAVVITPQETSIIYLKNQSRWFAPIGGFFDLESVRESVSGGRNDPQLAKTRTIDFHKPCSYAKPFVEQDEVGPFYFGCESGSCVMSKFLQSFEQVT